MMQADQVKEDPYADRIRQFWADFHVFPFRIERWGLRHWYLLIILPYAVVFLLTVVIGYLDVQFKVAVADSFINEMKGVTTWGRIGIYVREEFLQDYIFNSTGIGLFLAGSAFVFWRARLKEFFQFVLATLSTAHSQSKADLNAKLYEFLRE